MRSTTCLVPGLAVLLLAAGCDRQSAPAGQGNGVAADAASSISPDEVPARANAGAPDTAAAALRTTPFGGDFDRTHRGEPAPALGFTGADGRPTTLAAFRGKPVLLNLWATWCGPCVRELPTLDALAKRDGGTLHVVALSQDADPAKVPPFFAAHGIRTLSPYTDAKVAWIPAVTANLPTTILYDAAGREVLRTMGDLDWAGEAARKGIAEAK